MAETGKPLILTATPGIPKGYRTVENQLILGTILINVKITNSLELKLVQNLCT